MSLCFSSPLRVPGVGPVPAPCCRGAGDSGGLRVPFPAGSGTQNKKWVQKRAAETLCPFTPQLLRAVPADRLVGKPTPTRRRSACRPVRAPGKQPREQARPGCWGPEDGGLCPRKWCRGAGDAGAESCRRGRWPCGRRLGARACCARSSCAASADTEPGSLSSGPAPSLLLAQCSADLSTFVTQFTQLPNGDNRAELKGLL